MGNLTKQTIGQLLKESSEKHSELKAVEYLNFTYSKTWKELDNESDLLAKGLLKFGIKKNDCVAIWGTNTPEWLLLFLSISKIGAILVPINTNYKENEIEYILNQSMCKYLMFSKGFKELNYKKIIENLKGKLQYLKKIIYFGDENNEKESEFYSYKSLFNLGLEMTDKSLKVCKDKISCEDILAILYTSGTTSFPKGVMLTHSNMINNAIGIAEALNFTEKDKLCIPTPFFHCFGLSASIIACITKGATMIPIDYYKSSEVLKAVEKFKCTALHGVPTMFISLINNPTIKKFDLSSLRTGIIAGDSCDKKTIKKIIDMLGINELISSYGQTECSPAITISNAKDDLEKRISTVGKKMPNIEIKIVNLKTGKNVKEGEVGELCTRGYHLMKGYYRNILNTKKVIDENGWLHTGDLASIDKDEYYKIHGRIKDIIIRGGENISPLEIENIILEFEEISNCKVVGISDKRLGQEIVACLVINNPINLEKLKLKLKLKLADYKVPKYFEIFETFPTTASGKIEKYKLKYILEKKYNREDMNE
ncbi:MAG: AMP-binding protein [Fusobacteriaceae bacterium]